MGSFGTEIQVVEVTTDESVRGVPKKQLWIAAAPRDQAVQLVLAALPEGWTAKLTDGRLKPSEVALLKLEPGEVRELTKYRPPELLVFCLSYPNRRTILIDL